MIIGQCAQVVNRRTDIEKGGGPAAALAQSPILDAPHRRTVSGNRLRQLSQWLQPILGAPAAAMNQRYDWVQPRTWRQKEIPKLAGVSAINRPAAGRNHRQPPIILNSLWRVISATAQSPVSNLSIT